MRKQPIRQPASACETLESRRLFSGVAYSQTLADQLVSHILPANNTYSYNSPTVTWAGVNGATTYSNSSDCSNFDTLLLMQAYGFSASQFVSWTGYSLPQAKDLYNAALADKGFTGFTQIADLQIGDSMFIKYLDASTDTGHVVTVDALPVLVSTNSTQRAYNLTVVDCTADPHSNDTRSGTESGVGRGTMRLYTDLSGNLNAYAWGTSVYSTVELPSVRPAIFAKIPGTAALPWLSAGSLASYNSATGVLAVTGASSIIADPGSSQQPATTVSGSSSQLLLMPGATSVIHIASLTISNGASATVYDPNSGALLLDIAANVGNGVLSVDSTSKLDLQDNDAIIHGGNLNTISTLLARGFSAGSWQGNGIGSSVAGSDTTHLTALGAMLNTNGTSAIYPKFDGVVAATSDVLLRYTYYGDANLDGKVDASDYSQIDNGFLQQGAVSGWSNGDFNYDGVINGTDYTLIDNDFNRQSSQIAFSPSAIVAAALPPVKKSNVVYAPAIWSSTTLTVDNTFADFKNEKMPGLLDSL